MAVIDDGFTVGVNTFLVDHTPDTTGTGWTEIENTGDTSKRVRIRATADFAEMSLDDNANRKLYTAQGTYPSNDYDVKADIIRDDTLDDWFYLLGRATNSSNYYAAGILDTNGVDARLGKKVATVWTLLDSKDTDFNTGNWTGTEIKLEIRDAAKKLFADSGTGMTELLTDSDDVLTSTGEGGMGWGNIAVASDDATATWRIDNFLVTDAAPAPVVVINLVMAPYGPT